MSRAPAHLCSLAWPFRPSPQKYAFLSTTFHRPSLPLMVWGLLDLSPTQDTLLLTTFHKPSHPLRGLRPTWLSPPQDVILLTIDPLHPLCCHHAPSTFLIPLFPTQPSRPQDALFSTTRMSHSPLYLYISKEWDSTCHQNTMDLYHESSKYHSSMGSKPHHLSNLPHTWEYYRC